MADEGTVKRNGLPIGYDNPVFIIAEAGINHGGDLFKALIMASKAKGCGASAVKFQTFLESELPFKNISYKETKSLKEFCDDIGILFLSTPHTESAIDALEELVPVYKLASPRLYDRKFIKKVIEKGKPIILSVNEYAVTKDIEALPDADYIFMHTVCQYPADYPQLERLAFFMCWDTDSLWGYSDHTAGIDNCKKAITEYGACLIEKHFMLEEGCVDEMVSIKPKELEELCSFAHNA